MTLHRGRISPPHPSWAEQPREMQNRRLLPLGRQLAAETKRAKELNLNNVLPKLTAQMSRTCSEAKTLEDGERLEITPVALPLLEAV